jgi:hypothetical protein
VAAAQACGSGATTAGLALGNHLSGYGAKVIGYGVCDDEEYFYNFMDGLLEGLGAAQRAREVVTVQQSKGAGYAISRCAGLRGTLDFAGPADYWPWLGYRRTAAPSLLPACSLALHAPSDHC